MRNRFIGAVFMTALMCVTGAAQTPGKQAPGKQTAGKQTAAAPAARAATIGGHPNFNGIWQAMNTANWNLEAHSAQDLGDKFWELGAIAAIPAGKSMLKGGGTIPYTAEGLKKRDENRANWPSQDTEAKCFMLGIPRYTYDGQPFQIVQGVPAKGPSGDLLMIYPFAAGNRVINMTDHSEPILDSWMGKSDGTWDGKTLVVVTRGQYDRTWLDRAGNHHSADLKVTERFTLMDADHIHYEATLDDPAIYSKPWTIEMPLYRVLDENAQLQEHKCVPFADKLLYHDLIHPGEPRKGQE